MIPLDEVALLFRGWKEKRSRLRVMARSAEFTFAAFCTIHEARDDRVAFAIEGNEADLVEFLLEGCNCDFAGEPEELAFGGKVESAILAVRGDFNLTACLLAE